MPPTMPPISAASTPSESAASVATTAVAFAAVDVSACCVLVDNADVDDVPIVAVVLGDIGIDGDAFSVGGIADDVVVTVAVVEDTVEDNGADVVVGHTRDVHMHLVFGFVEQSC
jgi:hypothetical protein